MTRRTVRSGFTIAELLVAMVLGTLVMGGGLALLIATRTAEDRTWLRADATEQAVLAQMWLERDLMALDAGAAEAAPVKVDGGYELELPVRLSAGSGKLAEAPRATVTWLFDAASGSLARRVSSASAGGRADPGSLAAKADQSMRFKLGKGALVRFSVVDPGFASGSRPELGKFGNRISYRITAGAEHARGRQAITLVGAVPLRAKASRDTFPYWSRLPREIPEGVGGPS